PEQGPAGAAVRTRPRVGPRRPRRPRGGAHPGPRRVVTGPPARCDDVAMTTYSGTDEFEDATFVRASFRNATVRFSDVRGVKMRGVDVDGLDIDSHDLFLGSLVVNGDRKSTRLNSSHVKISYAVFC